MAIRYIRSLTGRRRTPLANQHLGFALAFVAGAINAGGFLAVQQYTSHMTGIVSSMADNAALGTYDLMLRGASALLSFIAGAACSAIMVNYSRRRRLHSTFAVPLLFEAFLLLCFGFLGARLAAVEGLIVSLTVMLLCFIMGLQNALITKVSKAEIRTTHITGIVTDVGIEVGKLLYGYGAIPPEHRRMPANRARLKILTVLALSFFAGGVAGAYGFKHLGYIATVPLSLVLGTLAVVPVLDDARRYVRNALRR
jgi:uncharacterized membrane protein YoaK (UPF0700 family)